MFARLVMASCFCFVLFSCDPSVRPVDNDYVLHLKMKSDTPVTFADSSRIKIKLWAYSKNVADAPATNLSTIDTIISSIDRVFTISFTKADFQRVTYQSGNDFGYYVSFDIDINNDGQICDEDYQWDYSKTAMMFFDQSETGVKDLDIYITHVTSGVCIPF